LDRGRWIWLLAILLALDLVLGLGDSVSQFLRYDRSAIAAGGWWRLLTAHIVHLDVHHLILNELGLVLMWSLFAQDYDAVEWCVIVLSGALAISSGLWWLSPRVGWYVGASGVLHSVMAAGSAKHLALRSWDRWILSIGLCAKLAWEQWAGPQAPLIVVDAHLYGALCGFAAGGALSARVVIIRHRSRA
jgi:rhomboid family GlyGly-CTERM serine protease